jgi:hypothetical protein
MFHSPVRLKRMHFYLITRVEEMLQKNEPVVALFLSSQSGHCVSEQESKRISWFCIRSTHRGQLHSMEKNNS